MKVTLTLDERDIGRLLVGVRDRRKKLRRGLDKFQDNWDEEKGKNLKDGELAYTKLEKVLKDALNHPHSAGRDPA